VKKSARRPVERPRATRPRGAASATALPYERTDPLESAQAAHLRYVDDAEQGFQRRKSGKGFRYIDQRGAVLRDAAHLERIRHLAIPPAWTDVWICSMANGHIQATGRDARGRK
jgi:DNA topoisomerase I